MNAKQFENLPPPPGVIGSLRAGFNVVSNRIVLIILPLVFDVVIWLGPRLSVGKFYSSFVGDLLRFYQTSGVSAQNIQTFTESTSTMMDVLNKVNWLSWARTFPIGIPSLMIGSLPKELPVNTPLGVQDVVQVSSFVALMGSILLMTLIGWLGGGLYFRLVSGATLGEDGSSLGFVRAIAQTFILSILWVIGLMVAFVPISLLLFGLASISPALMSGAILFLSFLSFWLIVPLFFTPHGIFVRRQNAFLSILSSLRMSRFTLPTSGMFVLSVFLLSQGLDYLWTVPTSDSWLMLVGIAGHAFITTTLLAASFAYYRDMTDWLQNVYERFQQAGKSSSIKQA